MYRACIFDLDGTLTDTLESLTYSVNETLKELNLPIITSQQCESFVGNGARCLIERALEAAGDKTLEHIEEAMEVYGRIFNVNCTYKVKPYDGIEALLQMLKEKDMKLAVLSNKPHVQTLKVVETYFGDEIFSHVQGQQEGIPRKPNPTAARIIAEKLGVDCKDCIYIGDSEVDVQTGNAAGMMSVGVTWGFRTKEILEENGAKHIIDHPSELILITSEKE